MHLVRGQIGAVKMLLFGFDATIWKNDNRLPVFRILVKIQVEIYLAKETPVKFWIAPELHFCKPNGLVYCIRFGQKHPVNPKGDLLDFDGAKVIVLS